LIASKFHGITFPFFGLKKVPIEIIFMGPRIYTSTEEGKVLTLIDDNTLEGDKYFNRLLKLEITNPNLRQYFDYTAKDITGLLYSDIKWGIDNSGKLFNLYKQQQFPQKCEKIKIKKRNLVWIHSVSYPFEIPKYFKRFEISPHMYLRCLYIDLTWHLYKFNNMYDSREYMFL